MNGRNSWHPKSGLKTACLLATDHQILTGQNNTYDITSYKGYRHGKMFYGSPWLLESIASKNLDLLPGKISIFNSLRFQCKNNLHTYFIGHIFLWNEAFLYISFYFEIKKLCFACVCGLIKDKKTH